VKLSFGWRLALSITVAGALAGLLFLGGGVNPGAVLQALLALPPGVYFLALGLHVVTYGLRAVRFQILVPRSARPTFGQALSVAAAHNMASYILPFKAGEAALVVYLKMQCGTPAASALAALFVSRFLDGATLCAGLAASCLALRGRDADPALAWLGPLSLVLLAATLLFLLLSLRGDLLVRALERALLWLRLNHWSVGQRLLTSTNGLALALRAASSGRWRLLAAALTTAPMWFTIFGFYALLAGALGIPAEVSFLDRAFGASLAALFNLLPINAAAGVGTQELGWVTGYLLLGVDEKTALTSGAGVHCVQIFNIVVMGVLAHLVMGVPRSRPGAGAG